MKAEETCPYCHKQLPPNSAFCVNCGRDLRFYEKSLVSIEKTQPEQEQKSISVNCTYCQKSSPEGSNFCVHCGKELQSVAVEETVKSNPSKKISSLFNILIFLAAIASIVGFIYFYVENKISTPADKNPIHEEIIGNLYRNTKYQFRIKFPEAWEIKKGDGPNILVKATSSEGSSINIYVKDLGIELGDITDLISLDEWANSVNEKFPSAKIIAKKEIYIDNRKAYFVQYSMNYKVLDRETDGICYNVSLINKNYNYAITVGSKESKFESDKQILDASVGTFVIEEYGTNITSEDQRNTFQSDKSPIKKEKEFDKPNSLNRPWFRNAMHGISFKTPKALEEQSSKAPTGYAEYIEKLNTYSSSENGISILFLYAETKFTTYDKKEGLSSSISNMVNGMDGTNLELQFHDVKNNFDDLKCTGSFKFRGSIIKVQGYIYWDGKGKFFLLTTMSEEKNTQAVNEIMESIRINIPIEDRLTVEVPDSTTSISLGRPTTYISLGNDTVNKGEKWEIKITVENDRLKDYDKFPDIDGFQKYGTKSMSTPKNINGRKVLSQSIIMTYSPVSKGVVTVKDFQMKVNGQIVKSKGKSLVIL